MACPVPVTARLIVLVALFTLCAACDSAEGPPEGVTRALLEVDVDIIAFDFNLPSSVEVIAEDEYLITERLDGLFYYRDGATVLLDDDSGTSEVEDFWSGLMDASLHPQFDTNGLVYLAGIGRDGTMRVMRFNFADRTIQDLELIFQSNAFAPMSRIVWQDDEHFFVTQGVGGNPYPDPGAQDLSSDAGKIHRLRADGSIPPDNPVFEGTTGPTSIWSYGHRDPRGLLYDADTGVLYATEQGPLGGDELNVIQKGANYGWPLFSYGLNYDETPVSDLAEDEARQSTALPLKHWTPDFDIAPSGLLKPAGSQFPTLNGLFLFGSLEQARLLAYDVESDQTVILLDRVGAVYDATQLPSGRLLITVSAGAPFPSSTGRLLKLTPR
ncbi:MAG: PQQ-dependent sugar dehydrogenase [Bacteroidota bacterium]